MKYLLAALLFTLPLFAQQILPSRNGESMIVNGTGSFKISVDTSGNSTLTSSGGSTTIPGLVGGGGGGGTNDGSTQAQVYLGTGTNVTWDLSLGNAYWAPTANCRFALANAQTLTNINQTRTLTIPGNVGNQITNIVDVINFQTEWGTLYGPTNYITIRWNGYGLEGWLDPSKSAPTAVRGPASTIMSFDANGLGQGTNILPAITASSSVALSGFISPSQLTANTDNWNPTGLATASEIRVSTDASRNLTGIIGQPNGSFKYIHNIGAQNLVLKNSATSIATNQFKLNADITLGADQGILVVYDLTSARWRAVGGIGGSVSGSGGGNLQSTGTPVAGTIPYYSDTTGTNVAPLATPQVGTIPTIWVLTNNAITLQYKKVPIVEEFISSGTLGVWQWAASVANSGVGTGGVAATVDDADYGIWTVTTAVLTNGAAGMRVGNIGAGFFMTNNIALRMRMKTPTALSSDVDAYRLYIGFCDVNTSEAVDGAYFVYSHVTSSGNWTAKTASNSARNPITITGTVAVVAATWYDLLIEGNATVVNFWVSNNSGSSWTHIGYSSVSVPNVAGRDFGIGWSVVKEAGSTGTTPIVLTAGRASFWPY